MKKLLVIFFLFICSFSSFAQDGWSAYMMPGIVHKQLAPYVGEWKATLSVWGAAEAQPESFDITAAIQLLMDGRFLEIKYYGEITKLKYQGLNHLGYNNINDKFSHIDFNSFGTGFTIYEGTWNAAQKVATLTGSTQNPEDKKLINLRETIKFIGPDEIVFEVYETREGLKEFKSSEIILYRKKVY